MKFPTSENIYLSVSLLLTLVLPFSFAETGTSISFLNVWLPLWIVCLFAPFYGIIQIVKFTDDWNVKYWIGLILNLLNFIFVIRFFAIDLLKF